MTRCCCSCGGYQPRMLRGFHHQLRAETELKLFEYGARPHVNRREIEELLSDLRERNGDTTLLPSFWILPGTVTAAEYEHALKYHHELQRGVLTFCLFALKMLDPLLEDVYGCIETPPGGKVLQVEAIELLRLRNAERRR
jgi:hypothetical protein